MLKRKEYKLIGLKERGLNLDKRNLKKRSKNF